ncbi:DUF5753 domain-containing protein [Streptosporangium amethystogenes]|uniref:DUF5753 domain-containing protein n=1 Tax=Streptosporangium amethystogenes TaxID=2002 RepID=UPI00247FD0F5|nr:DUF5753 domain-containing protein [Streptosporangium amethystogenes]
MGSPPAELAPDDPSGRGLVPAPVRGQLLDQPETASAAAVGIGVRADGLLQTEGYARAVMRSAPVLPPVEEMERRLSIRMKRQERVLERSDPPMMWCILNEAVIRRPVGGAQAMQDQLQRLIQLSERSHVTLQVLPFSAGVHPAMDGGFTILSFHKMSDPDTVYVEYWQGNVYLEDSREVDAYVLLFDHLRARALGPDQTRSLIEQVIREMRVDGEVFP